MKLFIHLLIFCLLITVQASAFDGRIVKVTDGDTVDVLDTSNKLTKVRLYGIDAPEKKQDFGQKSKQFVLDIVAGKTVSVEAIDTDRYGRTVGVVHIGNTVLNAEILKSGLAWYYEKYCKSSFCGEWQQIESQARSSKIGLWSIPNPQAPWDFRHGKKESGVTDNDNIKQDSVSVGNFHGNVSSKKFHKQGCKHYDCKSCSAVFSSRDEAVSAGYEPCGLCKP